MREIEGNFYLNNSSLTFLVAGELNLHLKKARPIFKTQRPDVEFARFRY